MSTSTWYRPLIYAIQGRLTQASGIHKDYGSPGRGMMVFLADVFEAFPKSVARKAASGRGSIAAHFSTVG
jgi:hypothetical protein